MKNLLLFLTISLLLTPLLWASPPTDSEIKELYNERPRVVYSMVRKLYVIEHASPQIDFPDLTIAQRTDRSAVVDFQGPMTMTIGEKPNHLEYEIQLNPKEVEIAATPDRGPTWSDVGVAGGIGVGVGLLGGILATVAIY